MASVPRWAAVRGTALALALLSAACGSHLSRDEILAADRGNGGGSGPGGAIGTGAGPGAAIGPGAAGDASSDGSAVDELGNSLDSTAAGPAGSGEIAGAAANGGG